MHKHNECFWMRLFLKLCYFFLLFIFPKSIPFSVSFILFLLSLCFSGKISFPAQTSEERFDCSPKISESILGGLPCGIPVYLLMIMSFLISLSQITFVLVCLTSCCPCLSHPLAFTFVRIFLFHKTNGSSWWQVRDWETNGTFIISFLA